MEVRMKIIDQVKEVVTGRVVFGEPYEKNGVTVIPMAKVSGGGGGGGDGDGGPGGGGVGLDARPAGAFVIKDQDVSWLPALDVNRIIVGAQIVAIVALLSWRSVAKARARRRA
jgi:uncharacterized spore protein YtfJ